MKRVSLTCAVAVCVAVWVAVWVAARHGQAARPAWRGTHFGAVLVVGAAVALVAFDQVSKRMRAHEYARPARRAVRRGDAMDG